MRLYVEDIFAVKKHGVRYQSSSKIGLYVRITQYGTPIVSTVNVYVV